MKFQDYVYERPDMEQFRREFTSLLDRFASAATLEEQDAAMEAINAARTKVSSMLAIARIRYSINTADAGYKAEQDYIDEQSPVYQGLITDYYKALAGSPFRKELEDKWGRQLFAAAELSVKTFSPEIVGDLKEENKKTSEYIKLVASAKIEFDGQERTLSQLAPYMQSTDRQTRKRATDARYSFFEANEHTIDAIYDHLVHLRTRIARKLGYRSFVELAYDRMDRTDYGPRQVAEFRKQVIEHIVPAASELSERRRVRLGLDSLKYYDGLSYLTGNPKPKGGPEWIVGKAKTMYTEMSPETDEFFRFMLDNGLMDLESKPGKRVGGYCSYISAYKAPFIFSNFNGTSHDVDVLTHEAGHAFQAYMSRGFAVPEYIHPTLDACEIHSMSMEFFAWPWIDSFFEEDTDKYKFSHLSGAITFIPYGVAVDEFQHRIYEEPDMTPSERKQVWREIERKYIPTRIYDDMPFLERGGFWHQQQHIFKSPFYYIDYTLAQICALQYWKYARDDRAAAWASYLKLCRAGGSGSFTELVKLAGLRSPFEDGCVSAIIGDIRGWLNAIDDKKL
ncbi:Oligoendopeptidase F, plasmid [Paenibacillus konkukensis]|uniref:Oligoendopeptidase F, plasmid n=1 Tax=Paenibacillus konkukensis TaxID=2020716 RepID=A0ABY4RDR4_9BACL|nr:M3 family oligoendopeptidase [Paenibacillus konkukensis]UQZ80941.1 Oligoendopeptidase F, plasmid [Paenibacillus konkukensis]